jgi:hypothetical protein
MLDSEPLSTKVTFRLRCGGALMLYVLGFHVACTVIFLGLAARAPVVEDPSW